VNSNAQTKKKFGYHDGIQSILLIFLYAFATLLLYMYVINPTYHIMVTSLVVGYT